MFDNDPSPHYFIVKFLHVTISNLNVQNFLKS